MRWFGSVALAHPSYLVNVVLLCAVLIGVAQSARRARAAGPLLRSPAAEPLPLAVLFLSASAYVIAERFLQIHILSALLLGLSGYGLVGLLVPPVLFRRGLPLALLLCAILPFGAHGSTLIGMGARVLCARAVEALLAGLGVTATSAETILVLESGVAHVDVPCSGLRSLWAGLCFFFAASWLGQSRPGLRWLLSGLLCAAFLLTANTLRVLCLVLCALFLGRPGLAEVLHVPLGVLGFLASSGATLVLLRTFVPRGAPSALGAPAQRPPLSQGALSVLLLCLLSLGLTRALLPAAPPPLPPAPIDMHASGLTTRPAPLTKGEVDLFSRFSARADKWRFTTTLAGGLSGSLLTVSTTALRAQHPPELCLAAAGLHIDHMETAQPAGFPVRHILLQKGSRTAVYWFQSRTHITADFFSRLVRTLVSGERRWVMVSMLLDDARAPDDAALQALLPLVRQAVSRSLEGVPR